MLTNFYILVSSDLHELQRSKEGAQKHEECAGHKFEEKKGALTIEDDNDTLMMYRG